MIYNFTSTYRNTILCWGIYLPIFHLDGYEHNHSHVNNDEIIDDMWAYGGTPIYDWSISFSGHLLSNIPECQMVRHTGQLIINETLKNNSWKRVGYLLMWKFKAMKFRTNQTASIRKLKISPRCYYLKRYSVIINIIIRDLFMNQFLIRLIYVDKIKFALGLRKYSPLGCNRFKSKIRMLSFILTNSISGAREF